MKELIKMKEKQEKIKFQDWQKVDLRVGKILDVEDIEGADKLYKLTVDIGEKKPRTLAAGLKQHYTKADLKDKSCVILANLEPKNLKGIESNGMILAAVNDEENKVIILKPESKIKPGTKIF